MFMHRMKERKLTLLICILIYTIIQVSAVKKSYIVYLGSHSHGSDATIEDFERAKSSHYTLLGAYVGSEEKARDAIFYSYTNSINGFAAIIEEKDAEQLANHPDVVSVFPDEIYKLHTTRSWSFLDNKALDNGGFNSAKDEIGRNVILATLDTGVWPESKSFSDEGMGPIPSKWRGYCEDNSTSHGVPCNRKLIGARHFLFGINSAYNISVNGSRDLNGHGSHTLSTAAGRFVPGANSFGYANGTARGGAPGAHVAAYKVCWDFFGCASTDILAAFDAAIYDNVDIISVSLGSPPATEGGTKFLNDAIALGSLHAAAKGITVVCSAGNSGPEAKTVTNVAPWVVTVGASTLDRDFQSYLWLGNRELMKGASLSTEALPQNRLYPLIYGSDAAAPALANVSEAEQCNTSSLDPAKVKGKIVICMMSPYINTVVPGITVKDAGGAGMIFINIQEYNYLFADPHVLPATMISYEDGIRLGSYMKSTKNPLGNIPPTRTRIRVKHSPAMADFSSRGPIYTMPEILKPDVTAPGVDILAAFTESHSPTYFSGDSRRSPFYFLSGTSMSCPHVSGVAGRVKSAHPDWSASAIKSAIMTTARTEDNMNTPIRDHDSTEASPFAYGNGHIRPIDAVDPGLVYDNTIEDYLKFLCTLGFNSTFLQNFTSNPFVCPSRPVKIEDLNYPSIAVGALNRKIVIIRRLKNVGPPGTYRPQVEAPPQIDVAVRPPALKFSRVGEEKYFIIAMMSRIKNNNEKGYKFGSLVWSDGKHQVRSSIAVNVVA